MNIKLTDKTINNAINNTNSTYILRDSILAGFGARIYSSGAVSYIIEPTVNRSTKRKVIGKYPAISVSQARVLAKDKIRELTADNLQVATSATFQTLSVASENYITQIQLKPSSVYEYSV